MKALSVAQMREADRRAIQGLGIPSAVLMDRAGHAVFEQIPAGSVGIVCGKGNNGGDGFVVARYCLLAGYDTQVVVLAEDAALSEDARVFKKVYTQLGGRCRIVTNEADWATALHDLRQCAVCVDAILGTGTRGEVTGLLRTVIEQWPKVDTVAVDIPSGLNADTGDVCGCALQAKTTVTFQWSKIGFEQERAQAYLGEVQVVDIGIPAVCADDDAWATLNVE